MLHKRALLVLLVAIPLLIGGCGEKGDFVDQVVAEATCMPAWQAEPAAESAWSAGARDTAEVIAVLCPTKADEDTDDGEQFPIVVLTPAGKGLNDLPGVTGKELADLFASYGGGVQIVHDWAAFANSLSTNPDSRQPDHGHLWAGTCEGSVFHRGGVNENLQGAGANYWLQKCGTNERSEQWAVWVPWAP